MRLGFLVVFALLIVTTSTNAQVSIRIVDMPESSLIYTPVYVTVAIRNDSSKAALFPVNYEPDKGASIKIGSANLHLVTTERYYDWTKWVNPGEEYFFQFEISRYLPEDGIYEIQATYRGDGQCRVKQKGNLPLQPISEKDRIYECFSGAIASGVQKVNIYKPANQVDLEVLKEVTTGTGEWRQNLRRFDSTAVTVNLAHAFEYLIQKYPHSAYTYAAGLYAARASLWGYSFVTLERIMKLNPNHPLTNYARMQWRLSVASKVHDQKFGQVAKERWIERAEMKVPKALEPYLVQFEKEITSETSNSTK